MNNSVHTKGAAMLMFIIFFVVATTSLLFVFTRNMYADVYLATSLAASKQAYIAGEAALEDVVFRIVWGGDVPTAEQLILQIAKASTTVTYDSAADRYQVRTIATAGRAQRTTVVELEMGVGSAFNYGLQTGNGGFRMTNSASIIGNAFANGEIIGQGSSEITGDVISAGSDGYVSGVEVSGSVWSQTLTNSDIGGDAYYNEEVGSNSVAGTRHTPFDVIEEEPMPIPDEQLDEWQAEIEATGTIKDGDDCGSGEYVIDDDEYLLGNVKIMCDLVIRGTGGTDVFLNGSIWVVGNIEFSSGPEIFLATSLNNKSVAIIADNPVDRENSGTIDIGQGTKFTREGSASGFTFVISRNSSYSQGGATPAIELGQHSEGELVLYTNEGGISVRNNVAARSLTGYLIDIGNNASVTYDTGLTNTHFSSGPGGGYTISRWYQE